VQISLDWVKDFVELPNIDADELANSFTMTTAEVEDVKITGEFLNKIKIVKILSFKKHPEADKLNLVTFDLGAGKTHEVVCGAPNVKEGIKVPYAPLGITLPNGMTLEAKKIRGILSEGMLCSAVELGMGAESSGLMVLDDAKAEPGQTMASYLNQKPDVILDVDNKSLTHRPDLWGHYGIAREFAAAYNKPLKNKFNEAWTKNLESKFNSDSSPIKPQVDKDSSCLGYFGLSVSHIKVGNSPQWIQDRLLAVGMRPINNIVDISNYVMLELGIPLHIFDRDQIADQKIIIKRVGQNSEFVTLDEVKRDLIATDTIIGDSREPLVLAGIMGGLKSGVTENTKNIFIEVANWKADEVRKVSTRLGLRTESSMRYEKSLDSHQLYKTLLRTLDLILEVCPEAKVAGKAEYDGPDLSLIKPLKINISIEKICNVLGTNIPEEKLIQIFQSLDFKVTKAGSNLMVEIPTFRTTKDISIEEDLIEEVGRIIGYDNITPVAPLNAISATRFEANKTLQRRIQDFLSYHSQAVEVMTYPLIGEKLLEKVRWNDKNENLVLINALSPEADRMRPTLIAHAIQTATQNAKHFEQFKFFEYGRAYLSHSTNFAEEKSQLLIGFFHRDENKFVSLLDEVEGLLNFLNIPFEYTDINEKFKNPLIDYSWMGLHPFEKQNIKIMGKNSGIVFSLHPIILKDFKTKGYFSMAVIDFSDLEKKPLKEKTKYTAISKFPPVTFECTVLVKNEIPAAKTLDALSRFKAKELTDKKIVTVFNLNNEFKAVTIKTTFEDSTKTLESETIKQLENLVVTTLSEQGFPLKK
jgi:phenylalanyl-tRNA synthetase beta chain